MEKKSKIENLGKAKLGKRVTPRSDPIYGEQDKIPSMSEMIDWVTLMTTVQVWHDVS